METKIANIEQIPEVTGSYVIRSNGKALYADFSANMRGSISYLLNVDREGLSEIRSSQNTVMWKKKSSLIEAMADAKDFIAKEPPELNQRLRLSDDYVYLAVDFRNAPVFKLESFTTGNLFYVGPFRNRFELMDTLYTMSELLGTPVCDEPVQPCSRLKKKKCLGWCLKKGDQKEMLIKHFLTPDFNWLSELKDQAERLMDDLEFEKADLITKQVRLLGSFYDNIRFLLCTKHIEGTVKLGDRDYRVEHDSMQYRDNELMAVDKTQYDERRAVYLWYLENEPEKIRAWMDLGTKLLHEKIQEELS